MEYLARQLEMKRERAVSRVRYLRVLAICNMLLCLNVEGTETGRDERSIRDIVHGLYICDVSLDGRF